MKTRKISSAGNTSIRGQAAVGLAVGLFLCGAGTAAAAFVTYPDLNVNFVGSASANLTTGPVALSLSPDHRFVDPNAGTGQVSANRYYGGTILWNGGASANEWGATGRISFLGGPNQVAFRVGDGSQVWRFDSNWYGGGQLPATNLPFSSSNFDFVFKFEDTAWNTAVLKLFVGANANTLTEGTADYVTIEMGDWSGANALNAISASLSQTAGYTDTASLQIVNFFSSSEWTPVSAVPEPATLTLLAGVAAALLVGRRRFRCGGRTDSQN